MPGQPSSLGIVIQRQPVSTHDAMKQMSSFIKSDQSIPSESLHHLERVRDELRTIVKRKKEERAR